MTQKLLFASLLSIHITLLQGSGALAGLDCCCGVLKGWEDSLEPSGGSVGGDVFLMSGHCFNAHTKSRE